MYDLLLPHDLIVQLLELDDDVRGRILAALMASVDSDDYDFENTTECVLFDLIKSRVTFVPNLENGD